MGGENKSCQTIHGATSQGTGLAGGSKTVKKGQNMVSEPSRGPCMGQRPLKRIEINSLKQKNSWHLRHNRHQNTKTSPYKLYKNGWVCAFFYFFLIPSEKYYNLQSCWITLYQFGSSASFFFFLWLGVIGLTLRLILSQVPDRTFLECFFVIYIIYIWP